jgi:gluconate 2-dehydrogenase gamma chain
VRYTGHFGRDTLHRREALKLLASGSTISALPSPILAALQKIHSGLDASTERKVFNAHQDATVIALAELIIPETDTPGAKSVRVNEFMDLIVAEWFSEEERTHFLAGLADLDSRAQKLFSKDFVNAAADQQAEILHLLGEEMLSEAAALANAPRGYRGSAPEPENNFYFDFRGLALTGYFTSEAGYKQQLREEIIPGHFDGCIPAATAEGSKA